MVSTNATKPGVPSPQSRQSVKRLTAADAVAVATEPPSENPRHHNESPHISNGANGSRAAAGETAFIEPPLPSAGESDSDDPLRCASALSHVEVLRRRSQRARAFARELQDHQWALMEVIRVKLRDYYWKFGVSPVEGEKGGINVLKEAAENGGGLDVEVAHERRLGFGFGNGDVDREGHLGFGLGNGDTKMTGKRKHDVEIPGCLFSGCKGKAMPLTSYCPRHITSDPKQTLYKPCRWIVKKKSAQSGQVTCGKPILQAAMPSLCSIHLEKHEKEFSQGLKKCGLNSPSPGPRISASAITSEFVKKIQAKRQE